MRKVYDITAHTGLEALTSKKKVSVHGIGVSGFLRPVWCWDGAAKPPKIGKKMIFYKFIILSKIQQHFIGYSNIKKFHFVSIKIKNLWLVNLIPSISPTSLHGMIAVVPDK